MRVRAVIFDLDGTITRPFLDFDVIRREMGLGVDAGPVLEAMEQMSPRQRREAESILDYHERRALAESVLNNGVRETVDLLRTRGIRVGVLTRNRRANALAVAAKHGLWFDGVVGREDGPVKPDASGVLLLCAHMGVEPTECLLVGDYLFDLLSAKAAGGVAVLLASRRDSAEFAGYADYVIDQIEQVLDVIEQG